jgi:peptidoglycan hydrolase CwlO-like protein
MSSGLKVTANPIRRVVTMLQMMTNKIEAEGKKNEELFEKFMCYCKNGRGDLQDSIDAAEDKIPKLEAGIKELDATVGQLTADIKKSKADRAEAKAAVAEATAIREKEAAEYAKTSGEMKTNVAAMGKAIGAISSGMEGAFLQTNGASVLRKLSVDMDMSSVDRDVLSSFLSESSTYAPASGQIVGILKQMEETMSKDLADATAAEESSKKEFDVLVAAKTKQIDALTKEIEDKTARVGDDGVKLSEMKEDLEDTTESLGEDKKFLAELEKSCETKQAEWDAICKTRTEELLALADTIKILNDDDALELFKKTLPAPALIQLQENSKEMVRTAVAALHGSKDYRLDLISLALKGRKVSFDKVLKMIDDMVTLLGEEQKTDDDKKEKCEADIDETEDKHKELNVVISDLGKAIEETKEDIATLTDEIAALTKGIKDLDKSVAEATENRKEDHEDYVTNLAANNAAVELIGMAKNRMQKFYNPSQYKAPPKRELTEEERITLNNGGTLAPTEAPGGIAGTGVEALQMRDAPPPPPEAPAAYEKKSEESNGVMAMMDMMVADLEKEIQEMEFNEKNDQEDYEKMIADSADKRARDSKSLTDKEAAKADGEASLLELKEENKAKMMENMHTMETLRDIHLDCDWLLQNFDTRKEARAGEVDALKKAKAVLSGADFSLIQTAHVHRHI